MRCLCLNLSWGPAQDSPAEHLLQVSDGNVDTGIFSSCPSVVLVWCWKGKPLVMKRGNHCNPKNASNIPTPKVKNSSSEELPRPISDAMLLTN